jgi:vacuolar-type H+-ATPase subunit F/Vma7
VTVANKISVIIDVAVDKGVTSLKKFRSAIGEAETASGKMRAGFDVAKESIVANAANIAMAAGGALIAFGVKSVKAFQDTALAAGKFSDATGVAVDEASRLIEVAGDIGVEAGTVETALGRMNKTLGASPQLFTDLGVEIAKTGTGATDVNGTFLNVVDRLNAIEDPAERARVASQLLGKGWQGMAELIGQGSTALKASLAGVADAQVIDPDELKKAREFRERMDDLNDRLSAIKMTVGEELVPALSDAAETIGTVTDALQAASSAAEDLTGTNLAGWAQKLTSPVDVATSAMDLFTDAIGSNVSATDGIGYAWDYFTGNLEDGTTTIGYGTEAAAEMARIYGERVTPAVDKATTHFEDLEGATARLNDTYAILKGTLDEGDALDKAAEATWNFRSETDRTEAEVRDYTRALADTVVALTEMPDEQKTNLLLKLEEGDLAAVEAALARYREGVNVPIRFKGQGSVGFEKRAMGGPVTAGTPYLVGERGPEIVVPGRSGTVIPNNRIGVGGGSPTTVNIYTNADPNSTKAALRRFDRRNGPGI